MLIIHGSVAQDQNYHNFADQRKVFGIPNFLNVITNLPFAIIGLLGLLTVRNEKEKELKLVTITLFTGFFLVTFGTGYYHL